MQKHLSLFTLAIFLISCGQTTIVNELKVRHDFNGDGITDVLVGGPDDNAGADAGAAWIFYGATNLASSIDASNADVKLLGEDAGDQFGSTDVSGVGDVNDDGIDDVIVQAYNDSDGGNGAGAAYIFYGSTSLPNTIDASVADVKLIGEDALDGFGLFASAAGDVNGDGIDDVIVTAQDEDTGGNAAGAAYIFFGSTSLPASIDASFADVKLIGEDATDRFGYGGSGAGDVNNDGFDDVIVGAQYDDDGGGASGVAFIFFGAASLPASIDASNATVKLIGEDAGDHFGHNVSTAGDVNNDGFDDVIVGGPYDDTGGGNAGAAYIFYGSENMSATSDASTADIKIVGEDAADYLGRSTAGGGDVNGDGIDDVIVGAPGEDAGGSAAGAAYIFFGSTSLPSSIDASVADVKLIGGDAGDNFSGYVGEGISVGGDFNADGISDILVGAYLDDDGGGASGVGFIFYGSTSLPSSIDASTADVKLIGEDAGDELGRSVSGGGS